MLVVPEYLEGCYKATTKASVVPDVLDRSKKAESAAPSAFCTMGKRKKKKKKSQNGKPSKPIENKS